MKEKIIAVQERITKLTASCSIAAKQAELLKEMLEQKSREVDAGMEKLEELYDFLGELEKEEAEKGKAADSHEEASAETAEAPKPKTTARRRGRPAASGGTKKTSPEARKEYYRRRYLKKKSDNEAKKNEEDITEANCEGGAEKESEGNETVKKEKETIAEINAKARAEGLSYGQYVAREQIRIQHEDMERARKRRKMERDLKALQEGAEET